MFSLMHRLALHSLPSSSKPIFDDFLSVLTNALLCARLENLLGKGLKLVEIVFEKVWFESIAGFVVTLCELEWNGFSQFVMPCILK